MKKLIKSVGNFMLIAFITIIFQGNNRNVLGTSLVDKNVPLKVGVMEYKSDDQYILEIHRNLEQIQKENPDKVQFLFFDGKSNQEIQSTSIRNLLQEGVDLLLVNIVDLNAAQTVIDIIKEKNLPVIFYNREPVTIDAIRSYSRAIFIGTDAKDAGTFQGKIIIDLWKSNKIGIDKNGDGKLQYVMLKGEPLNRESLERSRYSVSTINDVGINTEELISAFCAWDQSIAENIMDTIYLHFGNRIEAIISNNDAMAIGAINTLQKYGYNTGDAKKMIPIVGVDGIPVAKEYIEKGYMSGTVIQDAAETAKALYLCGINLFNHKNAINGTQYIFDDTGVSIRIPYKEYNPKG